MQLIRTIVVGTDFSDGAEHALDSAIAIANLVLARITLVHVCALSAEHDMPETQVSRALDDELLAACGRALALAVDRRAHCGVEVGGLIRSGKPWEKLHNVAVEVGASLVVVGRHGAGTTRGGDAGTVAQRLIRASSRPILVVPSPPSPRPEGR